MPLKPTVQNVVLAALVSGVYVYVYVFFLNPFFEYAGFPLFRRDPGFIAVSVAIAIAPALLFGGVRQLSSILAAFVYVTLYIPIILTFMLASTQPTGRVSGLQLLFMLGMCIIMLVDRVAIRNPFNFEVRLDLARAVLALTTLCTLYVLVVYRSNLRIVSFDAAVYELRSANAALGADILTRYLSSWLSNVFIPLCLAYGLYARRMVHFAVGTMGCIALYMAIAAKIMILLPGVFLAFYFAFRGGRIRSFFPLLSVGLSMFMAAVTALASLGGLAFIIASILLQRTIGNGGQVTMVYYDFFSFFPQTNYAHINVVNMITNAYPYPGRGVGEVVGQYYYDVLMNANANFWATDGIAALGAPGILVASVGFGLALLVMDMITRDADPLFVLLCFVPFITQVLNTSLFSSLWSGGGFFILVFFLLLGRRPVEGRLPRPAGSLASASAA